MPKRLCREGEAGEGLLLGFWMEREWCGMWRGEEGKRSWGSSLLGPNLDPKHITKKVFESLDGHFAHVPHFSICSCSAFLCISHVGHFHVFSSLCIYLLFFSLSFVMVILCSFFVFSNYMLCLPCSPFFSFVFHVSTYFDACCRLPNCSDHVQTAIVFATFVILECVRLHYKYMLPRKSGLTTVLHT